MKTIYLPDYRFLKEYGIEYNHSTTNPNECGYYKKQGDYFLENRTNKDGDSELYDFFNEILFIILGTNIGGIKDNRNYDELLRLMNDINDHPEKYYINEKREVFVKL